MDLLVKIQKEHFKDVNSVASMMMNATEIQKYNFWTILLDIRRAKKANELASCANDMDFLLDTISKSAAEEEINLKQKQILQFIEENHKQIIEEQP